MGVVVFTEFLLVIRQIINYLFKTNKYIIDPHTATGVAPLVLGNGEETEEIYTNSSDVVALATAMGKNKRSIIAKLVREGVYKAQPRNTTKQNTPVVRKAEIVAQIEDALGTQLFLSSLTKASKADLETLLAIIETNNGQS